MDVFENENNQEQTPPVDDKAAPKDKVDIWVEKLMTITRPDGTPKYETVEDALDAIKFQNEHIARIEQENAALAEKAKENETLQETIKRLGGNMNANEKPAIPAANGGQDAEAAEELVKKILNQTLTERDQVTQAVNNIKQVQDTLIAKFGPEKTRELVASKAKELGTSPEQLKQLSATNPKLVLELFAKTSNPTTPNVGSIKSLFTPPADDEIKRPEKSLISGRGATTQNQVDFMKKIRDKVYKENGIT